MLTASLVLYHNKPKDVDTIVKCVLNSSINRLYIIDNSRNDAFRILEKRSENIRYIHNENIGYGGAHNIAIREAISEGSQYHIVVNPDIIFEQGAVEKLIDYMDVNPTVGWVMPRVIYPNGELQYLCKFLPSPIDLIFRRFTPPKWFQKSRERFEMRDFGYDRELNVPFLSGCFMFLRVSALQDVGLFDERFFMYGEDIDLSRRVHARYRTMYYPNVTIIHSHQAGSYKNKRMLWIHLCNIVKYFNKWGWIFDAERIRMNAALRK